MSIELASALIPIGVLVLIMLGVPVYAATGVIGAAIVYTFHGVPGLGLVLQRIYALAIEHSMIAVPLFILMASILERSGIARSMYDAIAIWLRNVRGGVAIVTTIMATIMAAMSGIIGGEIVLLGLVALPQMLRLGYDQRLSIGTICAGGSLGAMIPPSIVLIMYGLVTSTSIHQLFIAAVVPGLMMALLYILYTIVRTRLDPSLAPMPSQFENVSLAQKLRMTQGLVAPILLVVAVLGSIYGGVTSITEAAAMGVVGALVLTIARRELSVRALAEALDRTFRSVGVIIWVTFGASVLAGAYTIIGGPNYVAGAILGLDLPPLVIIIAMMLVFALLGMFMDWIGIVLITMPVFLPIVTGLNFDKVWFGILFCINMQIAFLSPPFGPAAFYLKSVAPPEITLTQIYRSFLPFIGLQAIVLILVLLFPGITLFLLR
ncbi:MAG: TRAP transporter large permease subunit [Rhizobiaceae bacterium]